MFTDDGVPVVVIVGVEDEVTVIEYVGNVAVAEAVPDHFEASPNKLNKFEAVFETLTDVALVELFAK